MNKIPTKKSLRKNNRQKRGRLKIGDSWNAITIIALSQNNPLKAIAEFVENSLDAKATKIHITRGRHKGKNFLKIADNGTGIPEDKEGKPDFQYVATHICDSIKRQLKKKGEAAGIQGEFGIGLLSFWTVGQNLTMRSTAADGHIHQMSMTRGEPGYEIKKLRSLAPLKGTELVITDLLSGLRQLSGDKIQRYLASELRDRIRKSHAEVRVLDRMTRSQYLVEPRQFDGQLMHHNPIICDPHGEIYTEIYLNTPNQDNQIALYRSGTRVLSTISQLDAFQKEPWTSQYFQGLIDVPFLNLTPGTRDGLIHDERFSKFEEALLPLEKHLKTIIQEQQKQQDEQSNRHILKSVQKAIREALLTLPEEEYDWFDVYSKGKGPRENKTPEIMPYATANISQHQNIAAQQIDQEQEDNQKQFFEYAGPLHRVQISPSSCTLAVGKTKSFRGVSRDKRNRGVDDGLTFQWRVLEGHGALSKNDGEIVEFTAPPEPEICRVGLTVQQYEDKTCEAEAIITITDEILPEVKSQGALKKGLPGYTVKKAPGELWRSKYDIDKNIVIVNGYHRDFLFAAKQNARKVRYICRLYIKELVLANFLELEREPLLERMIEMLLYAEEGLK